MTKSISFLTLLLLLAQFFPTHISAQTGSAFEAKLLSFDRNNDGLIQQTELPTGSDKNFNTWDKDRDGALDQQEQARMVYFQANGKLPKTNGLTLVNGHYRKTESGTTVSEYVGRALSFDKNNDGLLDKGEIFEMAEAFTKLERSNRPKQAKPRRQRPSNLVQQSYTGGQSRSGSYFSGLHSQVQLPSIRSGIGGSQSRGRT